MRVVLATSPTPLLPSCVAHGPWQLAPPSAVTAPVSFEPIASSASGTVLDKAVGELASGERLVVVVTARHFAWFAAWASARGYAQECLLNAGCSAGDASDEPAPAEALIAAVRHATGALGVSEDQVFPMRVANVTRDGVREVTVDSRDAIDAAAATVAAPADPTAPRVAANEVAEWATARGAMRPEASIGYSFARVGLMGNPSDQLHGRSLAVTVDNFWARVSVEPSEALVIRPHQIADQAAFGSLEDIDSTTRRNGYSGGLRLVLAALKRFRLMCVEEGLCDPAVLKRNFVLEYDTNVPRQVGLAGSSCIVSAIFKAMAGFYGVTMNLETAPSAVLAAEWEELGIHAGLMDRVAQLWGGLVAMDFEKAHMLEHNRGKYERFDRALLPPLYLAYAMDPSDSGKIHSTVKERYFRGDAEVIAASRKFANFALMAVSALATNNHVAFANLVDQNFDLRRELYGDECLGSKNLEMVKIAREHTAAAKFPGSGGAILVVPKPGVTTEANLAAMKAAMQARGYVLIPLRTTD